jgi:RimJ/RimL family protein N-acetyltransferase
VRGGQLIDAAFEARVAVPEVGEVEMRCLTPGDGELLFDFFQALSQRSRCWFRPHWPWDRDTAYRIATGTEDSGEVRFLAMTTVRGEERPAGYGYLVRLQSDRPVLGIAVADEFQEQGVGQALMAHLVETARRLGKPYVRLTVDGDNLRARHVYEKTGFRLVRVIHELELAVSSSG